MCKREASSSQKIEKKRHYLTFLKKLFCEKELSAKGQALKITYIYFIIGCLWVLLSDKLVEAVFTDRSIILVLSIIKGSFYVLVTSAIIFRLIYIAMKKVIVSKDKMELINTELEKSNTLFLAILESSPEIIVFALDNNYCYTTFNSGHKDAMLQMWEKEITPGMNMLDIIQNYEDYIKAKENFDRALTGENFTLVEEYGDKKILRLYWQNYYSPIISNDGHIIGLTCFVLNITKFKNTQDENTFLSYHDKLTGLYNRRFYEEALIRIDTEKNYPISIIMGDVNGLKLVNDAFGHQVGDELLKVSAEAVTNACRPDDIVARWGGDEFIALLPKTSIKEAEKIVGRAKEQCSNKQVSSINVDISFGWATKEDSQEKIQNVIKNAEDFMYKNKIVESKSMRSNAIKTIMHTLHEKNPREEAHSKRVGEISRKIGVAMGIPDNEVSTLNLAGFLHDIGKIAIEESILNKPEKLTEIEFALIKQHPEIGCRIIRSSYEISEIAEAILNHHERWDGTGYPEGIKDYKIPKFARIIAIADSYDAMTSERPYKKSMNVEQAVEEIIKNSGKQFDPIISRVFVEQVLGHAWD